MLWNSNLFSFARKETLFAAACVINAAIGASNASEELYDEIDQEGLYEEAMEIVSSQPNRQGFRKAAALLKKVAKAGMPEAQYSLALLYAQGQGVRRNRSIAVKWFEESALQGYRAAMYNLAIAKLTGDGVEQDRSGAKRLFQELVYPGEEPQIRVQDFRMQRSIRAESSYFLASMLMGDREVSGDASNDSEIVELMTVASRGGSPNATLFLALERAKGNLLERDLELTKKYLDDYHLIMSDSLRRTVDQIFIEGVDAVVSEDIKRESEAMNNALYQQIYASIYGLSKLWLKQLPSEREVPIESIVELLSIAAEGGYLFAQIELGLLYARGVEVPADRQKALELLEQTTNASSRIAAFNRAALLQIGEGAERDETLARSLFEKAKNSGLYAAAAVLDGDLEPKIMSESEFLGICLAGLAAEDPRALYSFEFRREHGIGIARETNQKKLFRGYMDAAQKGSIQAMATVGRRYFFSV